MFFDKVIKSPKGKLAFSKTIRNYSNGDKEGIIEVYESVLGNAWMRRRTITYKQTLADIDYKLKMIEVEKELTEIKTLLAKHEQRARNEPKNWGLVAWLDDTLRQLINVRKDLEYVKRWK